jgi:hypothetical protein
VYDRGRRMRRESQKAAAVKKKGALIDKPVTFHTHIKSSGYGSLKPWAPKTPKSGGKAAGKGAAKLCPSYPVDGAAPTVFQVSELLWRMPVAWLGVCSAADAV